MGQLLDRREVIDADRKKKKKTESERMKPRKWKLLWGKGCRFLPSKIRVTGRESIISTGGDERRSAGRLRTRKKKKFRSPGNLKERGRRHGAVQ